MEKIGEEWTSNRVTSTYRIKHRYGRPFGCDTKSDYVFAEPSKFGWRFGLRYDDSSPEFEVYFDPHLADDGITKATVIVSLKTTDSGDALTGISGQGVYDRAALVAGKRQRVVCWQPSDVVTSPFLHCDVELEGIDTGTLIDEKLTKEITDRALSDSLYTGAFIDTEFYAFSRKSSSQGVSRPLRIFASSHVVKERSDYIAEQLASPKELSSESPLIDLDAFAWDGDTCPRIYDYEDDSDLEDEIECSSPKIKQSAVSDKNFERSQVSFARKVLVSNYAYTTWKAMIYYLYTGNVAFSMLKSQKTVAPGDDSKHVHRCSPKSMYRVAERLGLQELKKSALGEIKSKVSGENVVEEIFSKFTSRYPEIQEMEMGILCRNFSSQHVKDGLVRKMKEVAAGELPHSAPVLSALIQGLAPKNV